MIVDREKMAGDSLKAHVFHLSPWYTSPNITFKPFKSLFSINNSQYIIMRSKEVIVTKTDLNQYYDFTEQKYDTLTISYVSIMKCLDKEFKQIKKRDRDGGIKPALFYIFSNDVDLSFTKDIKPYLK